MANDNKAIGEIVKKCRILLLDIEGTTTSISFVKDKLFPYVEENVKQFLDSQWEVEQVKEVVVALRKLALEDKENNVDGVVTIPAEDASKEEQIEGLVSNVKWQMSLDRKTNALKSLQGLVWRLGYDKGDIKGHVYDDVLPALEQWHSVDGQKVYIYSSGSVQAQKLLFGQSLAGDLSKHIDGHFDTAVGAKQDSASYKAIAEKIGCKPDEILFLTDIVKEAEAAREAGVRVALVCREGNAALPEEAVAAYPVLSSLAQIAVTNKRKTELQDEKPAKIAKTDLEDVKITNEVKPESPKSKKSEEVVEKMEVENEVVDAGDKAEECPLKVETLVEEITDNEPVDVPIVEIEPVVIEDKIDECAEKTENKETGKMDTDSIEKDTKPKDNVTNGVKKTESEETSPTTIVTEIEEITDDKQSLDEVGEIIDDLEPVIEEPPAVEDLDVLKNVGEVLEKECDEILSKVQDVTNLDNIPIKPLLNPIAEEIMETDSGDIVESILDTELQLEMKKCTDIDLSTVTEMDEETKTSTATEEKDKEEVKSVESNDIVKSSPENKTEDAEKPETDAKVTAEVCAESEKVLEESKKVPEVSEKALETAESVSKASDTVAEVSEKLTENAPETKETKKEENKQETEKKEVSKTNGDAKPAVNGNSSKEDELSARLSVENGKEAVNGLNSDSGDAELGQGDTKKDAEVSDIKVKTVATEEPQTGQIEQPTEA